MEMRDVVLPGRFPFRFGRTSFRFSTPADDESIHRLNHETFCVEIPQDAPRQDGRKVDKFHDRNRYILATQGEGLVGMVALNDRPPFSIQNRVAEWAGLTETLRHPLEIRLLAVPQEKRRTLIFGGLAYSVMRAAFTWDCDSLLISGIESRQRFYRNLGFRSIGPPVGCVGAAFVPMLLRLDEIPSRVTEATSRFVSRMRDVGG